MLSKKERESNDEDNDKPRRKHKKLDPYERSKVRNLDRKLLDKDDDSDGSYDY